MLRFRYYQDLARVADFSRCIRCGYDLNGIASEVCPECGTNGRELADRARRAVSER